MNRKPTHYIALVGKEYVESGDSLAEVLQVLDTIMDAGSKEDVVIWQACKVVAVVRGDTGQVVHVRKEGGVS
jgi:hypothetical protein